MDYKKGGKEVKVYWDENEIAGAQVSDNKKSFVRSTEIADVNHEQGWLANKKHKDESQ